MDKDKLRTIEVIDRETPRIINVGWFHAWGGLSEHFYLIMEDEDGVIDEYSSQDYLFSFTDRRRAADDGHFKSMPPLRVGPEIQVLGGRRGAVPVVEPDDIL